MPRSPATARRASSYSEAHRPTKVASSPSLVPTMVRTEARSPSRPTSAVCANTSVDPDASSRLNASSWNATLTVPPVACRTGATTKPGSAVTALRSDGRNRPLTHTPLGCPARSRANVPRPAVVVRSGHGGACASVLGASLSTTRPSSPPHPATRTATRTPSVTERGGRHQAGRRDIRAPTGPPTLTAEPARAPRGRLGRRGEPRISPLEDAILPVPIRRRVDQSRLDRSRASGARRRLGK